MLFEKKQFLYITQYFRTCRALVTRRDPWWPKIECHKEVAMVYCNGENVLRVPFLYHSMWLFCDCVLNGTVIEFRHTRRILTCRNTNIHNYENDTATKIEYVCTNCTYNMKHCVQSRIYKKWNPLRWSIKIPNHVGAMESTWAWIGFNKTGNVRTT